MWGRHGCGLWKSIQKMREEFWSFIRFDEDKWIGEVPLKVAFCNLFSLAVNPRGMVLDSFDERLNTWCPGLHRNLNDWEVEELGRLLQTIDGYKPNSVKEDKWVWTLSKKGKFTTKSLYNEIGGFSSRSFPLSGIWIPGIPSKVAFFMWTVFLDKVLTLDHLQSRGWNLPNRCIMCLKEEESVDHLFLHCDMAHMVWSFFLSHLCISWSFPFSFSDFVQGWRMHELEGLPATIWSYLPVVVYWSLWKEQNSRIFEDRAGSVEEILRYSYSILLEWVAIRPDFVDDAWDSFW